MAGCIDIHTHVFPDPITKIAIPALERIVPFPSLHPKDPLLLEHLQVVHDEGFKGIKMHSYYQLAKIKVEYLLFSMV